MPELPEVERACKLLRNNCIGHYVHSIVCKEQGNGPRQDLIDEKFFTDSSSEEKLKLLIVGKKLISVERKGKYFWFIFESIKTEETNETKLSYLLLHFGMTGSLSMKGKKRFTYTDFKVDDNWPPKYCKFELIFHNNTKDMIHICITDPRRLARLYIPVTHPLNHPKISVLGPDPLNDIISESYFNTKVLSYKSPIKSILLDQTKICCGIGNYLADEILYQSQIHPTAKSNSLSNEQLNLLRNTLINVVTEAVKRNGDNFPSDWIFHHRWSKGKRKFEPDSSVDKLNVSFIKVAGRTTCIVAKRQKMGQRSIS